MATYGLMIDEYGTLEELAVKMADKGKQCSMFLP